MSRLITVFIECKSSAVQRGFEEILTQRPGYILIQANQAGAADVLILELDESNPQRTFSLIRSSVGEVSHTEIFLTASRTDPQMILEAFRLGVKEFIPQPIDSQEMEAALGRFEERWRFKAPAKERKAGKVIGIIGAKGGVGTSTVTTNIAAGTKHINPAKSVGLVDLNLHNSDLTLFLDLQAPRGLRDLSQDLSRLDETILHSVVMRHKSGIDLLPSGYDGQDSMTPASGCVTHTLDLMQSLYDLVFVDCGHTLDTTTKETLDFSSIIILVMAFNVPAIRRTKQLLDTFRETHYESDKIMLVANRYSAQDEELLRHTEDTLKYKIEGLIPNDYGMTSRAINEGQPLPMLAPRAAITQWYLQQGAIFGSNSQRDRRQTEDVKSGRRGSLFTRYLPAFGFDAKAKFQSS